MLIGVCNKVCDISQADKGPHLVKHAAVLCCAMTWPCKAAQLSLCTCIVEAASCEAAQRCTAEHKVGQHFLGGKRLTESAAGEVQVQLCAIFRGPLGIKTKSSTQRLTPTFQGVVNRELELLASDLGCT